MANGTILSLVQNTLQGMGVAKYGDPTMERHDEL